MFQVYEDGFDSSVALDSLDCYELTDFKSKLTAVLSRQFNRAEYDKLYKEANERKPLVKQKHLRSMSISYETNKKGQSYFDHFPGNLLFRCIICMNIAVSQEMLLSNVLLHLLLCNSFHLP